MLPLPPEVPISHHTVQYRAGTYSDSGYCRRKYIPRRLLALYIQSFHIGRPGSVTRQIKEQGPKSADTQCNQLKMSAFSS